MRPLRGGPPGRLRLAGRASATVHRAGRSPPLVVPPLAETAEAWPRCGDELRARTRALRRSVHLRHVDAGSDGTEEWEILALLNPVYDIHRLGIFLTASPRHADVLLATGAGARGMIEPLRQTYDGMPHPKVVIAVGTDAVSGGLASPSYATAGGVGGVVPVDVWLPGSPPSPFSILHALLLPCAGRPLAAAGRCAAMTAFSRCWWPAWRCWPWPPPPTWLPGRRWPRLLPVPYLLGAAGSACLAAAGAGGLAGEERWRPVAVAAACSGPGTRRPRPPTRCPACSCCSPSARRCPSRWPW